MIDHLELQVPSWTTEHSQGEDNVVFYAIDVRVTLAGASDDSSTVSKSVQRRFSDFRRLFDMLCMLYGHDRVPPILPVEESRAQSQRDVIGARREALDKWVRVLALDEAVGRSPQVTAFLQLDKTIKERRRRRGSSSSRRSSASAPGENEASGSGEDKLVVVKAFLASETAAKELLAAKVAELEREIADAREDCRKSEDHASQLAEKLRSAEESLAHSQSLAQRAEEDSRKARTELSETAGDLQRALSELGDLRPKIAKTTDAAEAAQRRSEELEAAGATMRTAMGEAMAARARAQADLRTLALEVKRVQRDNKSSCDHHSAHLKGLGLMLGEFQVLYDRMQDCTVGRLLSEENASEGSSGASGASNGAPGSERMEELFQLSDNRITCLLAEVQLISKTTSANGDTKGEGLGDKGRPASGWDEARARQFLSKVLIDHAHLHRACNRATRDLAALGRGEPVGGSEAPANTIPPPQASLI